MTFEELQVGDIIKYTDKGGYIIQLVLKKEVDYSFIVLAEKNWEQLQKGSKLSFAFIPECTSKLGNVKNQKIIEILYG